MSEGIKVKGVKKGGTREEYTKREGGNKGGRERITNINKNE